MKKAVFFISYLLTPVVPVLLYLKTSGAVADSYGMSVILGITAFIFLCNQFLLATRPVPAVQALGVKGLLAFHGTMAAVILIIAGMHKNLKEANGFSDDTFQATFGSVSFWVFAAVTVFAALFMANTVLMKIELLKSLKEWVYKKTMLTYKGARVFHNVTVVAGLGILVHVFLASSSDFGANPFGIAYMAVWMTGSLTLYFGYRFKGRTG